MISAFKRLLRSTSSAPTEAPKLPTKSTVPNEIMVTTRGQKHAEQGASAMNTPVSSRKQSKKTVGKSATGTPVPSSKKSIPVRAKEETRNTTVVVEIPVTQLSDVLDSQTEVDNEKDGKTNELTPKANKSVEKEGLEGTKSNQLKESETTTEMNKSDVADNESTKEVITEQAVSHRGIVPPNIFQAIKTSQETTVEQKQNADKNITVIERIHTTRTEIAGTPEGISKEQETPSKKISKSPKSASAQKPATSTPAKPKHKRFGSEEPDAEIELLSTAPEIVNSDDEESSDDDVVEEITAQDASKSAAAKERDAASAIEEQENALRQKRKERDAALKKQSDAAAKKRKRASDTEGRRAQKSAASESETEDAPPSSKKARFAASRDAMDLDSEQISALPDFLLGDDNQSTLSSVPVANKTKFTDKKVKDRRKGSTTYRVADVSNSMLAPKADTTSRHAKEQWMQNREGKGASLKRTPWKAGFFKNGKPDPPRTTVQRRFKPSRN